MPVILFRACVCLFAEHVLGQILNRLLIGCNLLLEGNGMLLVGRDVALLDLDFTLSGCLRRDVACAGLLSAHFARRLAQV